MHLSNTNVSHVQLVVANYLINPPFMCDFPSSLYFPQWLPSPRINFNVADLTCGSASLSYALQIRLGILVSKASQGIVSLKRCKGRRTDRL